MVFKTISWIIDRRNIVIQFHKSTEQGTGIVRMKVRSTKTEAVTSIEWMTWERAGLEAVSESGRRVQYRGIILGYSTNCGEVMGTGQGNTITEHIYEDNKTKEDNRA